MDGDELGNIYICINSDERRIYMMKKEIALNKPVKTEDEITSC